MRLKVDCDVTEKLRPFPVANMPERIENPLCASRSQMIKSRSEETRGTQGSAGALKEWRLP